MKKLGNTPPVLFWFDGRSDLFNACDLWWHCYWGWSYALCSWCLRDADECSVGEAVSTDLQRGIAIGQITAFLVMLLVGVVVGSPAVALGGFMGAVTAAAVLLGLYS